MNASQTIFNYIRNNPYKRFPDAVTELTAQGIKRATVEALLYQMVSARMLSRDKDDMLTALQTKYTSISARARRGSIKPKAPAPAPAPAPISATAKQVLESMTIKEAYTLHIALKEMFNG